MIQEQILEFYPAPTHLAHWMDLEKPSLWDQLDTEQNSHKQEVLTCTN